MEISNIIKLDLFPNVLIKDDIDYKEIFHGFQKDSFKIIILVARYDIELHQLAIRSDFLNGNLEKYMYMDQPMGFTESDNENIVCKLKK